MTLVGHRWDTACGDLRRFLARNQISFNWLTPDAPELATIWPGPRPPDGDLPCSGSRTERCWCGPRCAILQIASACRPARARAEYDVAIVGGGPAGLAAAVYGASEGLRTIVVEREAPGGQAGTSSRIENYLGFPSGVSGDELASRALQQARRLGAEILVTRSVARIDPTTREVLPRRRRRRAGAHADSRDRRHVASPRHRRLRSAHRQGRLLWGRAQRSGATHGLDVHLVGAGNSAGQAALNFANHARKVTLVVRGDALENSMSHYLIEQLHGKSNVAVQLRSEIHAVHGDTHLTAIDIRDNASDEVRRHECGGLFVFIGADAETAWLPADIARDARGYVLTGDDVKKAGRWSHEPRSLSARDERARRVRVRRRAPEPGQTRCLGRRRGQHGDRVRPPVSGDRRAGARSQPARRRTRSAAQAATAPKTSDVDTPLNAKLLHMARSTFRDRGTTGV